MLRCLNWCSHVLYTFHHSNGKKNDDEQVLVSNYLRLIIPWLDDLFEKQLNGRGTAKMAPRHKAAHTQINNMLMPPPLRLLFSTLVAFYTGGLWRILTTSPLLVLLPSRSRDPQVFHGQTPWTKHLSGRECGICICWNREHDFKSSSWPRLNWLFGWLFYTPPPQMMTALRISKMKSIYNKCNMDKMENWAAGMMETRDLGKTHSQRKNIERHKKGEKESGIYLHLSRP